MIAYCSIDSSKCDAYIATITNDSELKKKTAKDWSKLSNATILPKHINCNGCRKDGAKTIFCSNLCPIRKSILLTIALNVRNTMIATLSKYF